MRVILSAAARGELGAIEAYIGQDSPQRAVSFVEELRACCLSIGDAPVAHPVVHSGRGGDIRRCVYGRYLLLSGAPHLHGDHPRRSWRPPSGRVRASDQEATKHLSHRLATQKPPPYIAASPRRGA